MIFESVVGSDPSYEKEIDARFTMDWASVFFVASVARGFGTIRGKLDQYPF
jgi:hypothetical protein